MDNFILLSNESHEVRVILLYSEFSVLEFPVPHSQNNVLNLSAIWGKQNVFQATCSHPITLTAYSAVGQINVKNSMITPFPLQVNAVKDTHQQNSLYYTYKELAFEHNIPQQSLPW
jgi:hypothetical protein